MTTQNWFKTAQETKKLVIMRGISGSGKSTLAKELVKDGVILSTDDFFMVNGEYKFDRNSLGKAHQWNQNRAEEAMKEGKSPVVIDNTNTQAWEAKPYAILAQKYGYEIEIKEPNTPWKFNAEELAKRNQHGVPKESIENMIKRWQHDITSEDILQSEPPKRR